MADAARLLPFLGLFLILLPILWQPGLSPAPDTARGGVYLFTVWIVLILGTMVLSRVLGASGEGDAGGGAAAGPTGAAAGDGGAPGDALADGVGDGPAGGAGDAVGRGPR